MTTLQDVSKAQPGPRAVLVTGAGGYLGTLVTRALAADPGTLETIVATDLTVPAASAQIEGVTYVGTDIRAPQVGEVIEQYGIDAVVHLASIVTTGPNVSPALQFDVDVNGTRNVLAACLEHGVRQLVVTSSGAAYGYHADNASWLTEDEPLRGNEEFPYAYHKRLVEELLAEHRAAHPGLGQLILRPGTILGEHARGPIADFFEKPVIFGLKESATPFVFIWDEDVVGVILEGLRTGKTGTYNLAGDGVMTLREVAAAMGKPFVPLPSALLERALSTLQRLNVTQYGPEQVLFLAYRPVLANERLKTEFGYKPRKTSREVFELYRSSRDDRSVGGTGAFSLPGLVRELLGRRAARAA